MPIFVLSALGFTDTMTKETMRILQQEETKRPLIQLPHITDEDTEAPINLQSYLRGLKN